MASRDQAEFANGKEFIAMAARELSFAPKYRVPSRPMVRLIRWFNPLVGEVHEMLYQNDSPYLFDSSKFAKAFSFSGTPRPKEFAPPLPFSRKQRVGSEVERICLPLSNIGPLYWRTFGNPPLTR